MADARWTLRDARRNATALLARPVSITRSAFRGLEYRWPHDRILPLVGAADATQYLRRLDSLVARYGARALVNDVIAALTPQQEDSTNDPITTASSPWDSRGADEDGDEPRPSDRDTETGGALEPSSEAPGKVTMVSDRDLAAADNSPSDSVSGDRATEQTAGRESVGDNSATPCEDGVPVTDSPEDPGSVSEPGCSRGSWHALVPISRHGGDTGEDWERIARLAEKERQAAREIARALLRLIRATDITGRDASPRVDARRLVRAIASRRYSLARTKREELAVPLVLLCCDVSWSCSAVCNETLAAAKALAERLPDVLVIRHSNGMIEDVLGARAIAPRPEETIAGYARRIRAAIGAVIAWGDWDAGNDYRELAEQGATLYWLDSYCAKDGARPASRTLRASANEWRAQPAGWWQGVNNAKTTAIALRAMAKGL